MIGLRRFGGRLAIGLASINGLRNLTAGQAPESSRTVRILQTARPGTAYYIRISYDSLPRTRDGLIGSGGLTAAQAHGGSRRLSGRYFDPRAQLPYRADGSDRKKLSRGQGLLSRPAGVGTLLRVRVACCCSRPAGAPSHCCAVQAARRNHSCRGALSVHAKLRWAHLRCLCRRPGRTRTGCDRTEGGWCLPLQCCRT